MLPSSPLSDLKIFDKLKGCFSFLPQHLHQHAPQSQHQGAAGSGDDLGEGQKLHAFRAAQYGYVAGTAHIGGAHAGGGDIPGRIQRITGKI